VAQQRVQHAKDEAEAEKALETWDHHLSKARELAGAADYPRALVEIEQAMRLVKQYGIREEGATYNEAYATLERIAGSEVRGVLLQLLTDKDLIETKEAIISRAVAHLQLDSDKRAQLAGSPQTAQIETLRDLLAR
jgi:hypothetical protein